MRLSKEEAQRPIHGQLGSLEEFEKGKRVKVQRSEMIMGSVGVDVLSCMMLCQQSRVREMTAGSDWEVEPTPHSIQGELGMYFADEVCIVGRAFRKSVMDWSQLTMRRREG